MKKSKKQNKLSKSPEKTLLISIRRAVHEILGWLLPFFNHRPLPRYFFPVKLESRISGKKQRTEESVGGGVVCAR